MKNPWKRYSKICPQLEDGFRQITSCILQALMKADLSGSEFRIILAIIDKTWGFKKTSESISVPDIMESTGLKERTVREGIVTLKAKQIIYYEAGTRVHRGAPLNEFMFNKHYDTWKQIGCTRAHRCTKTYNNPAEGRTPLSSSKEKKYIKELSLLHLPDGNDPKPEKRNDLKPEKRFEDNSMELRLSEYLFKHILKNNPNAKKPNMQSWAKWIDLMIRVDNRKVDEIKTVIAWCQKDSFWLGNILSTKKLRDQFDQLCLKMKNNGTKPEEKPFYQNIIKAGDTSIFDNPEKI